MSHPRSVAWLGLAVACAGAVAGCGDDPLPGGPSGGVISVAIQGPVSIAPGQSAQYAVIERLADGTTRALAAAAWASSDSSLVQVTSSGVATAQSGTGEVLLSVKTTQSASKEVLVLPANTFRLVGSVTDMQGAPIPNARVEVIGGPSATAGSNGAYRLYGVPPEAELRVTAGGYVAVEQRIQLSGHTTLQFQMLVDPATGVEPFLGMWLNEDSETESITRVQIVRETSALVVHMWGSCIPECDWGTVTASVSSAGDGILELTWNAGFKITTQKLTFTESGRLLVESYNRFMDNSGRPDYSSVDYFSKRNR